MEMIFSVGFLTKDENESEWREESHRVAEVGLLIIPVISNKNTSWKNKNIFGKDMKGHILKITWQIWFLICFKCFENMSLRLSAEEAGGTLTYCDRPDDSYRCSLRMLECPVCTSSSSSLLDLDNLRSLRCVILYLCRLIRQRLDAIISHQRILSRIFSDVKNISAKWRKIFQLSHAGSLFGPFRL